MNVYPWKGYKNLQDFEGPHGTAVQPSRVMTDIRGSYGLFLGFASYKSGIVWPDMEITRELPEDLGEEFGQFLSGRDMDLSIVYVLRAPEEMTVNDREMLEGMFRTLVEPVSPMDIELFKEGMRRGYLC